MKNRICVWFLSLILVFTIQACFAGEKKSWKINKAKISEKTSEYTVDFSYPEIIGMKDAKTSKYINDTMKNYANRSIADFKKEMAQLKKEGFKSHAGYDIVMKFKSYDTDNSVSFVFEGGRFMGGAHPEPLNDTFVFDTNKTGKIAFQSLFNSKSDFLKKISAYCISDLNKQDSQMADFAKTGAAPDLKNFKWFYITGSRLVIVFPPSTAGPYAAGTREVKIPFDALSKMGIVNPSGVLGKLTGH